MAEEMDRELHSTMREILRMKAAREQGIPYEEFINPRLWKQSSLSDPKFPTALPAAPYATKEDWKRYIRMLYRQLFEAGA